MIKLVIDNIDGYIYSLISYDNKRYNINMEFYNIEKPEIGNILYLNKSLLKERILSFDYLDSSYGKDITDPNNKDIIVLVKDNKNIYLKRIYG